ncbi:hypothetical protein [Aliidiomarina sanyensis]|uniref:hypothetical protein n=1 Tax=Aliidiomarina sanyensis TaxID=1249555 RepID=UPI000F86D4D9|nr:hypothetical protein [Aliidiomarina sanyensis]
MIDYKSGDFSETGTRLSAGYQIVGTDQWRVNVLAGREFIFDDKNFVEVQVRYEFTDRFSVFYHLQNNSGWMRNEGYLGLGYRF